MKLPLAVLTLAVTWSVAAASAEAQGGPTDLARVRNRLQAASAAKLNLIAPETFARARQRLAEAESIQQRGANPTELRRKLDEALVALSRAESLRDLGMVILGDAIQARTDALVANAPTIAERDWRDGERALENAGKRIEDGNQGGAKDEAAKALTAYREAEFKALRQDLVGGAEALREAAKDRGADKKASATYLRADAELAAAERALRENRKDRSEAIAHAKAAADGYRRASRIALVVDAVSHNRNAAVEKLVLDYESYLSSAAAALNFEADFSEGAQAVSTQLTDAITGLREDRDALRSEVTEQEAAVARLQRELDSVTTRQALQTDSLDAQLARQQAEQRRLTTQLRARQERENRIRSVINLFASNEAEVVVAGNDLVIRLYGIQFPVGSAQIRPENFSLLTKLQRAIREFPDVPVEIGGHTDARGNDDVNLALSERRAESVRDYLVANMALPAARVSAVGYGESQPIASNESADGRARNRRIDVRIVLPPV